MASWDIGAKYQVSSMGYSMGGEYQTASTPVNECWGGAADYQFVIASVAKQSYCLSKIASSNCFDTSQQSSQ
ncbi:hypothetical protein A3C17_02710 [Candidatus Uhrbacteria bacterium RIFCSPHIGHO2_02_FULL_53_13]|uniref:Uncharacterized protein n=1 Tax=Candidatus Uhrbacteria bacterium RIFCSPHIGHO2_02_FULL_53_13 TaxID=1802389 RepID=A0A1F7U007_9BACT|nr:MAG: hypothetical protein A3C17_02710 [Candidatus Uhrbacteria bacterium RIFCSPHIGHO2_02_FULL_53_13]